MDKVLAIPHKPRFRDAVSAVVGDTAAEISRGDRHCSFEFARFQRSAVSRLIGHLEAGGLTTADLAARSPEIAEEIPMLLVDFDRLRLLVESEARQTDPVLSGAQLYREVRRLGDRVLARVAKSAFYHALVDGGATRDQLIGYALEYHWIVQAAPGLIGPALATAHSTAERALIQDFLKSELGHDRFLRAALQSVGVTPLELDAHQPLPATFALCASLGVYARQHPLSFKACLFLFEWGQPDFVLAFDRRCQELGLPEAFYAPMRAHADLNTEYDHGDISRTLMEVEGAVDRETAVVIKRHVSLMIETMIRQEEQILEFYGQPRDRVPRLFG
jgi:hypothetical protein